MSPRAFLACALAALLLAAVAGVGAEASGKGNREKTHPRSPFSLPTCPLLPRTAALSPTQFHLGSVEVEMRWGWPGLGSRSRSRPPPTHTALRPDGHQPVLGLLVPGAEENQRDRGQGVPQSPARDQGKHHGDDGRRHRGGRDPGGAAPVQRDDRVRKWRRAGCEKPRQNKPRLPSKKSHNSCVRTPAQAPHFLQPACCVVTRDTQHS